MPHVVQARRSSAWRSTQAVEPVLAPGGRWTARTVVWDGEPVAVQVERVTVGRLGELTAMGYPRGASPAAGSEDALYVARLEAIDAHIKAAPGSVYLDDMAVWSLGELVGGRQDLAAVLYHALLSGQTPSADEQRDLKVASRFQVWLDQAPEGSAWRETGMSCAACHAKQLCGPRGCDGTVQLRVVWHDRKLALKTCPVRSFTPQVEEVLRLFYLTHTLAAIGQSVTWQRIALVRDGGIEDQDAWLMDAMGIVRHELTRLFSEHTPRPAKPKTATSKRERTDV